MTEPGEMGLAFECLPSFVLFSVPPSIQAGPRVMKVQVGHPIDLPCVVQGVPEPTVTWLKDGAALLADGSQYSDLPDGTLAIAQVGVSDAGVYTCVASNVAGRDEADVQVQVQGASPGLSHLWKSSLDVQVCGTRLLYI